MCFGNCESRATIWHELQCLPAMGFWSERFKDKHKQGKSRSGLKVEKKCLVSPREALAAPQGVGFPSHGVLGATVVSFLPFLLH